MLYDYFYQSTVSPPYFYFLFYWVRYSKSVKGKKRIVDSVWDGHVHTAMFKGDNHQRPAVYHSELCSLFCSNLNGKIIWKRIDSCIRITESLWCTPETNRILLINYTPI